MTDPTATPTPSLSQEARQARNLSAGFLVLLVAALLFAIVRLLGRGLDGELLAGFGFIAVLTVTTIVALRQALRDRPFPSAIVLLTSMWVIDVAWTLLMAGNGVIISLLFIAWALAVAGLAVPLNRTERTVLVSLFAGLVLAMLDAFLPLPRPTIDPQVQRFVVLTGGGIALAFLALFLQRFQRFTFRTKLLLILVLVSLVPVIFAGTFVGANLQSRVLERQTTLARQVAQLQAQSLDSFLVQTLDQMIADAESPTISERLRPGEPDENPALIEADARRTLQILLRRAGPRAEGAFLLTPENTIVLEQRLGALATGGLSVGQDLNASPGLNLFLSQGTAGVSQLIYDPDTGDASIFFVAPVFNTTDRSVLGKLLVQYEAEIIDDVLAQGVLEFGFSENDSVSYAVFDANRVYLAHTTRPDLRGRLIRDPGSQTFDVLRNNALLPNAAFEALYLPQPELATALAAGDFDQPFTVPPLATGETPSVAFASPVSLPNWTVVVFQPEESYTLLSTQLSRVFVAFAAITLAAIAAAIGPISSVILDPLRRFGAVAEAVADGDFTARAQVLTDDEIGTFAERLNLMVERLDENTVALRERLQARTEALQTVAEISRAVSEERDAQRLMERAVDLIADRFDLYYAGIFTLNESADYAVLRAGYGSAGQAMLADNHRLQVGGVSMIGQAIATRNARLAMDVGEERVRFQNPHLPFTRTELALPMRRQGEAIGALTIQSTQPQAFDEPAINTFQSLADELAVALGSVSLLDELQATVSRVTQLNEALLGGTWQIPEAGASYIYHDAEMQRDDDALPQYASEARQSRAMVLASTGPDRAARVSLPVIMRNEVVGVIELVPGESRAPWSQEELSLMQQIVTQTGYALENAMLIDRVQRALTTAQEGAERERTLRRVTADIRQETDIEAILKTTLARLTDVLGAEAGEVELRPTLAERAGEAEPPHHNGNGAGGPETP